ncbi:MAG: NAD(P)/FAD-dependent oxidoreductase [Spirochaetota bacterium]
MQDRWDVVVIGSGPAGLAAAASAATKKVRCCIIEREERPGGILKQCIHDGFGLIRYNARLTGPEYAWRELEQVNQLGVPIFLSTYIDSVQRTQDGFRMSGVNPNGSFSLAAKAIVLATGCRERTARQIFLHGSRPAGVFTAGLAQYFINVQGYLPTQKCVILGSGDIGLIMARRLVLEGAEVEGVYEIMPQPSGLPRNLAQCLDDYGIPLYLSTTVTRVHGRDRLEGVTTMQVDLRQQPVPGTERYIECDSLILSVGLIPENEIAVELGAEIDPVTKGPVVNDAMMCTVPGLFSCGNSLHVSDLVDYVSETGETAGREAAHYTEGHAVENSVQVEIPVHKKSPIAYFVPQRVRKLRCLPGDTLTAFFRVNRELQSARLKISAVLDEENLIPIFTHTYRFLRPSEMERIDVGITAEHLIAGAEHIIGLEAEIEEAE